MVRAMATVRARPIAILGDLQGPRIRIGDIAATIHVEVGQDVVLCHEPNARAGDVPVTYDDIANDVNVGDRNLVDDG